MIQYLLHVLFISHICVDEIIGVPLVDNYVNYYKDYKQENLEFPYPLQQRIVLYDTIYRKSDPQNPRFIWDILGNWIQNSEWFPIEVNIPDTISNIGNGFQTFTNNIVQRIPFLNRPQTQGNVNNVIAPNSQIKNGLSINAMDKVYNPFMNIEDGENELPYP